MLPTLDEIADRQATQELDGRAWIASIVEERPPEIEDAFAYVLAVDRRVRDERLAAAERREREWRATKEQERREAPGIMAAIEERTQ